MVKPFGTSIVASTFAMQGISIGLSVSLYPVFMESLEREFGTSRTLMSFGIPALLIAGALASPSIGRAIDRGSPRPLMATGVALMSAGLLGIAWAPSFAAAVACWMLLLGVGHALCGVLPSMTILSRWFVRRRATMISIAAMGTTAGGALVPPIAEALIDALGWRGALATFAAAAVVIGLPIVFLGIVKRPEDRGLRPDGAEAPPGDEASGAGEGTIDEGTIAGRSEFWFLGAGLAVMTGVSVGLITHIVPFAIERGFGREEAVALLSVNAVATAIGKLAFGALADRLGPLRATLLAVVGQAFGWSLLLAAPAGSFSGFFAGTITYAFCAGCLVPCQAAFVVSLFGSANFGRAAGLLGPLSMTGVLILPAALGFGFDHFGGYATPMQAGLLLVLLPLALLPFASPERAIAAERPA